MKITIPLERLIEFDLSADDYVFMWLMQNRHFDAYSISSIMPDWDKLTLGGFVEGKLEDLTTINLTPKGNSLLGLDNEDVETFSKKYRNLFKDKGLGKQGDEYTVTNRMNWFKRNFEFSNEEILLATVKYIDNNRRDNFRYLLAADNFIMKHDAEGNPTSKLAAWCEDANTADENDFFTRM